MLKCEHLVVHFLYCLDIMSYTYICTYIYIHISTMQYKSNIYIYIYTIIYVILYEVTEATEVTEVSDGSDVRDGST